MAVRSGRRAAGQHEHLGKTYYFCSTHCVHKFRAAPHKYVNPDGSRVPRAASQQ
ncbi:MAG: YHS domain-containing protein, partial [Flavobacteriales bacterium]